MGVILSGIPVVLRSVVPKTRLAQTDSPIRRLLWRLGTTFFNACILTEENPGNFFIASYATSLLTAMNTVPGVCVDRSCDGGHTRRRVFTAE